MKCPSCGKEIPDYAQACVYCWEEVPSNSHSHEEARDKTEKQVQTFGNEATPNYNSHADLSQASSSLKTGADAAPQKTKTTDNSNGIGILGCVAITTVILGGYLVKKAWGPADISLELLWA